MSIIKITSDSILPNIEHHFRVFAGPGAGKTHWLTEHIRNVLHNSDSLAKSRKVACITYTNIAVETILGRLGTSADRVEVSTIHSFLYKHVLKPYAFLIASDYGLNVSDVDGHDDIILSNYKFLTDWKTKTRQLSIRDDAAVVKAFRAIKWKFDAAGDLKPLTDFRQKVGTYSIKTASYLEYKKMAWEKGVIHHDDVLFFSYQIIKKNAFVLDVIRAKFPYIFIDEFQDSSSIQVAIFKSIGIGESIIGVIGDTAQSIYKFQGADPKEFKKFDLPGIVDYLIEDNKRSSNEIVDFLNFIRKDIVQAKHRNQSIGMPIILVGEMNAALKYAKTIVGESVHSLSRDNITANALKKEISGTHNPNLFKELAAADKPGSGNKYRSKIVEISIKAVEYARDGKFKDALKEMEKEFKSKSDPIKAKRISLDHITTLLSQFDTYKDGSLYDFFLIVKRDIKSDISNLAAGAAKRFYETNTYKQLALCVKVPEDISLNKTIHKAKGDEFENVMLVLSKESDIQFILNSDLENNEEHRINYVAVSRAKDRLFINVPSLDAANQALLKGTFQIHFI